MSEKPGPAKLEIESDEKSKEIAPVRRECNCSRRKTERVPSKKPMEETEKTAEKKTKPLTAKQQKIYNIMKTSHVRIGGIPASDPEAVNVPKISKTMSKTSAPDKPETPKVPEVCKRAKIKSEISTSDKPESPKIPEVCKIPKTISEISTSDKPETSKVPEVCKRSKIMSEIPTSDEPETPKLPEACKMLKIMPEITLFDTVTSDKPETSKASEVCKMSETTSEISTSEKPETPKVPKVCKMPKTMSEISIFVKPETPKIPEVCEIPKTLSEISIFNEPETPKIPEVCEIPKTMSEISTFDKPETAKIPEVCEIPKTMSEISISDEPETPKVPEVCQPPKITLSETFISDKPEIPEVSEESETTSEISTCIKSEDNAESPKNIKNDNPKFVISIKSEHGWLLPNLESEDNAESPKDIKNENPEISTKEPEESSIDDSKSADNADHAEKIICEKTLLLNLKSEDNAESPKDINNENPEISTKEPEESSINDSKSADNADNAEKIICEKTLLSNLESEDNAETPKDIKNENPEISTKEPEEINDSKSAENADNAEKIIYEKTLLPNLESEDNAESPKDIKNENPEISTKKPEESSTNDTKSADNADNAEKITRDKTKASLWNVAAMRKDWPPLSNPNFENDCLILATVHMLPSFPMKIFELFAEMIEAVTNQPVVLIHERHNRPTTAITKIANIIIAPAAETEIEDFALLPVSFVFDHYQNKTKSASIYADVVVASDRAPYIKKILDLRGHCCAVIDEERNHLTADGLLFLYLQSRGENESFFGNTLVANTQLEVLEMVASRQAVVGILETPVSRCNMHNVPGSSTLQVLASIGPLPPYRIMIDRTSVRLGEKIERFLLNVDKDELWMERLMPFGILGFAPNSSDRYKPTGTRVINPGVPYY